MSKPILVFVGRKGWTAYYEYEKQPTGGISRRVSGYSYEHDETPQKLKDAGVPILDIRPMDITVTMEAVLRGPLLDTGEGKDEYREGEGLDGCGYSSMNLAPLDVFVSVYEKRGAIFTHPS